MMFYSFQYKLISGQEKPLLSALQGGQIQPVAFTGNDQIYPLAGMLC
jgi:hypothetical protein